MIELYHDIPEVAALIRMHTASALSNSAINPALTKAENVIARRYIKQYAHEYLTCKKMPFRHKLLLFTRVYLPIPLSRIASGAILVLWEILKKIRDTIRRK